MIQHWLEILTQTRENNDPNAESRETAHVSSKLIGD